MFYKTRAEGPWLHHLRAHKWGGWRGRGRGGRGEAKKSQQAVKKTEQTPRACCQASNNFVYNLLQIVKLCFQALFSSKTRVAAVCLVQIKLDVLALIKYLPDIFHPVHIDNHNPLSSLFPSKTLSQVSSSRPT